MATIQQTQTMPESGTIYSVPHPKAFTSRSYILLDRSYDDTLKAGPGFLDLLGDEEKGQGFLKDVFATIAQARTVDGQKQDFFAVIHSVTPDTKPNRVSQQAYFHGHVAVGGHDDKFVKAVRDSQSYGQGGPHREKPPKADGLTGIFEPDADHRLAPFHRIITVNANDLEDMVKSDEAMASVRRMLLDNIPAPSGRTGVRLALDTFNYPDNMGIIMHVLGDFNEELVTDKGGKTAQRRWFETPNP